MTLKETLVFSDTKIIYSPSEEMTFYIQQKMQEKFNTSKENKMGVETERELKEALSNMTVAPLSGDYWITNVRYDTAKISQKSIEAILPNVYDYGMVIVWVKEYKDLMRLTGTRTFDKHKHYVPVLKFSFLDEEDMLEYYKEKVPSDFMLEEKLLNFTLKNYKYDPKAFTRLVSFLQGGKEFETVRDLIEEVGLGRSSVESLVLKLLTTTTKTKKGIARLYSECILYIENLRAKYEYRSIINFINYSLDTIIDIKQLQIRGIYNNVHSPMSDVYDKERIMRMKRFDYMLLDRITLIDALNLRLAFMKSYNNDARTHIMTALSYFMDYLYWQGGGDAGEEERERIKAEKREKKRRQKEELKLEQEAQEARRRAIKNKG